MDMINNMIENPLAETRSETIGDILTEMTNYAIHQFKADEELLSIHNSPRIDAQKQMHKEFRMNHPAASSGVSTKDKIDLSSQATGY